MLLPDLYADNCNSGYVMVCSNCFLWMTAVININTVMPPWYPVVKIIVTTQFNIDIGRICRLFYWWRSPKGSIWLVNYPLQFTAVLSVDNNLALINSLAVICIPRTIEICFVLSGLHLHSYSCHTRVPLAESYSSRNLVGQFSPLWCPCHKCI